VQNARRKEEVDNGGSRGVESGNEESVSSCDNGGDDSDSEAFAINAGCTWAILGLLQTLLLCPIGPVDAVEQNVIELQYSRNEV